MTPLWFSSFTRVRLLQPTSLWTKQALRHTHHWQQRTGQNAIFFRMIIHIIDNHNCSTFSLSLQYMEQNVVVWDILIPKLQLFIGAFNESVNSYSYGCQIYVGRSVVVILLPKPPLPPFYSYMYSLLHIKLQLQIQITNDLTCLQEVMSVRHEFVCCTGCCWCATNSSCGYEVAIEAPVGNIIGYAKQQ